MVNTYWISKYDPQLSFWDVLYDNNGVWYQVAACVDGSVVDHIVEMHNNWYQNEVFNTYVDNVTLSAVNEVVREIIADNPEDGDFWQTQILTDISQLPEAPHVLPF